MTVEAEGPPAQRFAYVDALRLFCALAVVLFHYGYDAPVTNHFVPASYAVLPSAAQFGRLGVQAFFVISGFVIAFSAEGRTWHSFLWARFLRLYPAYWLAVLLTSGVLLAFSSDRAPSLVQALVNLTMLQNYIGVPHVDGVYHTLVTELRFYIMVAALLFVRLRPTSLTVIAAWLALCFISPWVHPWMGKLLLADWAPYFAAGMIIRTLLQPGHSVVKWLLLAAAIGLQWRETHEGLSSHYRPDIDFAVVTAGTLAVLACAFAPNPRDIRLLGMIGAMTYPLYLLHNELGTLLMRLLVPVQPEWLGIWPMVLAMLGLAWFVSQYPEPAIRNRLKRLRSSRR